MKIYALGVALVLIILGGLYAYTEQNVVENPTIIQNVDTPQYNIQIN